jgi:hypothetical protein
LDAIAGTVRVNRLDFPPASPRPGLPAGDIHFNFVVLTGLFALERSFSSKTITRILLASALLAAVHVLALLFEVKAVYATRLGTWSSAHYGSFARNFWAGGFHMYLIAGRFAAPFAIWWGLRSR